MPLCRSGRRRDLTLYFSRHLAAQDSRGREAAGPCDRFAVGVAGGQLGVAFHRVRCRGRSLLFPRKARSHKALELKNSIAPGVGNWNFSSVCHGLGICAGLGISNSVHDHAGGFGHGEHAHARHDACSAAFFCAFQVHWLKAKDTGTFSGFGDPFHSCPGSAMGCAKRCLAGP
jgi:hypothetical protein